MEFRLLSMIFSGFIYEFSIMAAARGRMGVIKVFESRFSYFCFAPSLLIGNGIAYTLLVIIFAKVITAQSFVQSCDFLAFSHNLRSFLRF